MKKVILPILVLLLLAISTHALVRVTKTIQPIVIEPVKEEPLIVDEPVTTEPSDGSDAKEVVFHKQELIAEEELIIDKEGEDPDDTTFEKAVDEVEMPVKDVVIEKEITYDDADAKEQFMAAMNSTDVAMYTGHARYGSGPDMDNDTPEEKREPITLHGNPEPWDDFRTTEEDETLPLPEQNEPADLNASFDDAKVEGYGQEDEPGLLARTINKIIYMFAPGQKDFDEHSSAQLDYLDANKSTSLRDSGEQTTFWARVKSWFVGPDRGMNDLPEVGEEAEQNMDAMANLSSAMAQDLDDAMEKKDNFTSTLSDIMNKSSQTQEDIVGNLK